jgi:hypothetical protein
VASVAEGLRFPFLKKRVFRFLSFGLRITPTFDTVKTWLKAVARLAALWGVAVIVVGPPKFPIGSPGGSFREPFFAFF